MTAVPRKVIAKRAAFVFALWGLGIAHTAARAEPAISPAPPNPEVQPAVPDDKGPQAKQYNEEVRPLVARHCLE